MCSWQNYHHGYDGGQDVIALLISLFPGVNLLCVNYRSPGRIKALLVVGQKKCPLSCPLESALSEGVCQRRFFNYGMCSAFCSTFFLSFSFNYKVSFIKLISSEKIT